MLYFSVAVLTSKFIYCLNISIYTSVQSKFIIKRVNTCKHDLIIWLLKINPSNFYLKRSTIQCECQVCKLYSCILFVNENLFFLSIRTNLVDGNLSTFCFDYLLFLMQKSNA